MALIKREYKHRETAITAENLNDIQDAIIALERSVFTFDNEASGEVITVTDASNMGFKGFSIYGKTTQDGTPTPDAPVELVSVGDGGSITINVTDNSEVQRMTVATHNGLPGIPVTSGGNYTDANGQQWICDEIDFARGVHVARTRKITLTGTENVFTAPLPDTAVYYRYRINTGVQYYSNVPNAKIYDGYCTHYRKVSADEGYNGNGLNSTAFQVENLNFYVDLPTVDTFRTFLAEQYALGAPVEVLYVLATPIETPLTTEELAAYAALHTYKEHTTVSNDAGAHMEIEYAMDAKKYIDSILLAAERS